MPVGDHSREYSLRILALAMTVLFAVGLGAGAPGPGNAQESGIPRVHAPLLPDEQPWAQAGIFWFGRVDPPGAPGLNYADVRVGYTAHKLRVFVNVEDYYLWHAEGADASTDLTLYDAVAVYLDIGDDRSALPQPDDFVFFTGLGEGPNYQREAQGTGEDWNFAWQGTWSGRTGGLWPCNPGPNSNVCGPDFGWWSIMEIPWTTLGLSAPPAEGTVWGLGVLLHDRDDQPPAGYVSPQGWPASFQADAPMTWGELAFGVAQYTAPDASPQGTTVIRRGLGDSVVEDAWVGGGGTCSGGHEGDPDSDNHGGDTSLFTENQSLIADFPCFSKTYLRFHLDGIPPGKSIISATLTLHQWSNANPSNARPSLVWLFAVDGDWAEYDLSWNNAPQARENLTTTWVDVCTPEEPCPHPGTRYDWDATQAVAEAYAANQPLNVALYTADTNFDSSKYFSSSEAGDWNAEARPALTVVWGAPLATVSKAVWPIAPSQGQTVTYSLTLVGNGLPLTLTDDLPSQVGPPGPIRVTPGQPSAQYEPGTHRLAWSGAPAEGETVTIGFATSVTVAGPEAIWNTAMLSDAAGLVSADSALLVVNARRLWLPLIVRSQ